MEQQLRSSDSQGLEGPDAEQELDFRGQTDPHECEGLNTAGA